MAKGISGEANAWNLGLYPAVGGVLGVVIGIWLDRKFGWEYVGMIAGGVLGLASGMYLLIKEALKVGKD